MFVTFTISPLLFIFLICKSQFKLDGISWRRGKSQDSKLFLWFATRQERGERSRRGGIKICKVLSSDLQFYRWWYTFWSLLRPFGILVAKAVGNLLSSDPCAIDLFLFFCLLIFGPKFVVHRAINRGRGGGLLARFILNITICWLFLHLHFYCRIYSDYPDCWRKNWGKKWVGRVGSKK